MPGTTPGSGNVRRWDHTGEDGGPALRVRRVQRRKTENKYSNNYLHKVVVNAYKGKSTGCRRST